MTENARLPESSLEREQLIQRVTTQLAPEFASLLDQAIVAEQVTAVVDGLIAQAHVTTFVPLVAEKLAREQLRIRVAGPQDTTHPA